MLQQENDHKDNVMNRLVKLSICSFDSKLQLLAILTSQKQISKLLTAFNLVAAAGPREACKPGSALMDLARHESISQSGRLTNYGFDATSICSFQ